MAIVTREKLATFGVEVVVVVLGILIAFQVEDYLTAIRFYYALIRQATE